MRISMVKRKEMGVQDMMPIGFLRVSGIDAISP
jgi:hypothetical protein